MKYIVKPGHALSTGKGIIGPPIDPENPTAKEIITEKNFKNGQKGLTALLQHKKCPLIVFEKKENTQQPEKEKVQTNVTTSNLQQTEKEKDKSKGAVKK